MRIILAAMVLLLAACSGGGHSGGPAGTPAPLTTAPTYATAPAATPTPGRGATVPPETGPGGHTVTFAISGSVRRASITYTTPDGRKRHSVVSPPWSKTFTVADGQSVDVNAHSTGDGELTCTLKVDGELLKSATSSGDSATVDCGDDLEF
jgi:hypothetical protein